jgi:hypothetical protein
MNSLPKIQESKKSICSRILTPKQVGPICWFMATFVAMFYSQRSRKILLEASKGWKIKKGIFPIFWNNRKKLFTLLKHVLDDKYLKTDNRKGKDYKNYKRFSDNTFGKILTLLNRIDKKSFPYIPNYITGGFELEYYIGKLYKLLNVDYILYDYNPGDDVLLYSYLNENLNKASYRIVKRNIVVDVDGDRDFKYVEEDIIPPPILMVIVRDEEDTGNTPFYSLLFPNNIINEEATKNSLKSMKEQIFFKGVEYNLDAVLLANWNIGIGHAIAGITCKKKKYIYNGWTRTSMDPSMINQLITRKIPCELMKYDWNIKNDGDFCLNTAKCIPEALQHQLKNTDICFNFSKGGRLLIYVRKDANYNTSADSYNSYNNYTNIPISPIKQTTKSSISEVSLLNTRAGGRRILTKNSKVATNKPPKTPKKCPEGKILNPKTGRYILDRKRK